MSNTSRTPYAGGGRLGATALAVLAAGGTLLTASAPVYGSVTAHAPSAERAALTVPSPIYNAPNSQDYEDNITTSFTAIPQKDKVQFVLTAAPNVTWWKGVRVTDKAGTVLVTDFTQDAKHRTAVLSVGQAAVKKGAFVIFSKAKTFGVHTDMYTVRVPIDDLGYRVDINWIKDDR